MAQTEEDEIKILSEIRAMEEEEMKNRLMEAFMDQMKSSSRSSSKKPLFIDASYENNAKSFQRHQQQDKVHALTLWEVSHEIHDLKSEISILKFQIVKLGKGKSIDEADPIEEYDTTKFYKPNVQIYEGRKDTTSGFQEMKILAIEYQQHPVQINVCIQGQMFKLTALIDFGANVNILNKKVIPTKYWMTTERKVIGLGSKTLKYEIRKASICFDNHCITLKFAVADIPVDCILGNIFLATVEPHGSFRKKRIKVDILLLFLPPRMAQEKLNYHMSQLHKSRHWFRLWKS